MPDDRLQSEEAEKKLPKPEVYIVRNGEAVFKPGMKTWFVETRKSKNNNNGSGKVYGETGTVVGGTVCTCDKVCTCNTMKNTCPCQKTCSCQVTSTRRCTCNTVCTCNKVH